MKLSTKTRYGTRILMELALHADEGALQVSRIAASQKIPVKYLEQLLRQLRQAGYVKSLRGPKGGHILIQSPDSISLGQIARLFEAQTDLVACVSLPDNCLASGECVVRQAWKNATQALFESLDSVSIADLIEATPAGVPVCPDDDQ